MAPSFANRYASVMTDFILSLAVLSAFVLMGGAIYLYRKHGPNRQSLLMGVMAFVLLGNVLIWQIPVPDQAANAGGAPAAD